jgi:hypothetical protein
MTKFYDQDAIVDGEIYEDGPECLGPEGDCTDTHNDPRCPVHGGMRAPLKPDRRSTARRSADRSIIADQQETIRALEGRLALAKEQSGARLQMLGITITHCEYLQAQRDEAVRLLRLVHLPANDGCSGDGCAVCDVRNFLAGLES